MRTIKDALDHAESQGRYPVLESQYLITDFILLADELRRLRTYGCNHPQELGNYAAFVSAEAAHNFWEGRGMKFNDRTPVRIDPQMVDNRIHFPQGDGTCIAYNV